MLKRQALIIRTDGDNVIGSGHVMRCLALGQAWKSAGGDVVFAMALRDARLKKRIQREGFGLMSISSHPGSAGDARETSALVRREFARWVVVDGYHFNSLYQRILKDSGASLLFIDDYGHASYYSADIVLNQNVYAHEGFYKDRESYTRLLLGPQYVLLRKEFYKWINWERKIPKVASNVLVSLGGSNVTNNTLMIIQCLQRMVVEGLNTIVVIGSGNNHHDHEIMNSAVRKSRIPIKLEHYIHNMPELMAQSDVAIAAAGSTTYELSFMGLPSLFMVCAENQRLVAKHLDSLGAGINIGWHETVSADELLSSLSELIQRSDKRATISQRGRELIDCEGAFRVCEQLENSPIRLRKVHLEDRLLLWEWANEPSVREASFSSKPISWEEHVRWFQTKLDANDCYFYIGVNSDGEPVGQIRYDINENSAVVSVSIGNKFRYKGYGKEFIRLASKRFFMATDMNEIHAYIKSGNDISLRVFHKVGFQSVDTIIIKGYHAAHLILRKGDL